MFLSYLVSNIYKVMIETLSLSDMETRKSYVAILQMTGWGILLGSTI